jgi:hypothetical protein
MEWFRFYHGALDDPKVQRLQPALFKHWVNLLCLASQEGQQGSLPGIEAVAFRLRVAEAKAEAVIAELTTAGLIERDLCGGLAVHNWSGRQRASDDVAERVRRSRERAGGNNDVTLQETLHVTPLKLSRASEQNRTDTDTDIVVVPPTPQLANGAVPDDDDDDFSPTYPTTLGTHWPIAVNSIAELFPSLPVDRVEAMLGDVERDVGPLPRKQLGAGLQTAYEAMKIAAPTIKHPRPYARKVITERLREVANVRH